MVGVREWFVLIIVLPSHPPPYTQISAILMVPIFMYGNTLEYNNQTTCNIFWPESDLMKSDRAFTLYSFTLGFFIPFILIFLFYILVICKLRKVGPKNKSKEKKRSHRKVTYLVLTVISVYAACWLPYWIGQLYITFAPRSSDGQAESDLVFVSILLAGCLSYANSGELDFRLHSLTFSPLPLLLGTRSCQSNFVRIFK